MEIFPTITLEERQCPTCGVHYAVDSFVMNEHRKAKGSWYCPNGHRRTFGESDADRLRKQLALKDAETKRLQERLASERDAKERIERSRAAIAGQVTKLKNRAKNGVCPCCNRSFSDLRRHMATKHPDFAANPEKQETAT